MKKHTPGPWRFGTFQVLEDKKRTGALGYDRVLCTMPPWHEDNIPELEANLHLIAAAPDLLHALRGALIELDKTWVGLDNPTGGKWWKESKTRQEIVAVIAKAEGRE